VELIIVLTIAAITLGPKSPARRRALARGRMCEVRDGIAGRDTT
jgi:hypothetical protein